MSSKNNKKINSIIKIPSKIKSPGKYGSARNSYREVSNIHQLYQDLFITDMKDEIDIAGNEL